MINPFHLRIAAELKYMQCMYINLHIYVHSFSNAFTRWAFFHIYFSPSFSNRFPFSKFVKCRLNIEQKSLLGLTNVNLTLLSLATWKDGRFKKAKHRNIQNPFGQFFCDLSQVEVTLLHGALGSGNPPQSALNSGLGIIVICPEKWEPTRKISPDLSENLPKLHQHGLCTFIYRSVQTNCNTEAE